MAPPQCTGSARGFGSTTTRRCWRQCAGRAVCAAFTSSTPGSRPLPRSGSIDGGEGARGGVAGSEGSPRGRGPARQCQLPRPAGRPHLGEVGPGEGAVSREEPGTREAVSPRTNGLGGWPRAGPLTKCFRPGCYPLWAPNVPVGQRS